MHQVVLYTRDGCSLCVTAKAVILALRRELDFAFSEVDIGFSGELYEDYKHDIPVIEIDGKRAFKHRVEAGELTKRLSR
ncbi:MAG: glutaredoxin family protein [Deltaproteobacteria bacterium]|nr:MAG: glutaredoxin family protein [Deltaproteobacteria bacterium]